MNNDDNIKKISEGVEDISKGVEDILAYHESDRVYQIESRLIASGEERKRAVRASIAAGIFVLATGGLLVANDLVAPGNLDVLSLEFQSLFSYDALIEYFRRIGPGVLLSVAGAVVNLRNASRHFRESRKLQTEANLLEATRPSVKKRSK